MQNWNCRSKFSHTFEACRWNFFLVLQHKADCTSKNYDDKIVSSCIVCFVITLEINFTYELKILHVLIYLKIILHYMKFYFYNIHVSDVFIVGFKINLSINEIFY